MILPLIIPCSPTLYTIKDVNLLHARQCEFACAFRLTDIFMHSHTHTCIFTHSVRHKQKYSHHQMLCIRRMNVRHFSVSYKTESNSLIFFFFASIFEDISLGGVAGLLGVNVLRSCTHMDGNAYKCSLTHRVLFSGPFHF